MIKKVTVLLFIFICVCLLSYVDAFTKTITREQFETDSKYELNVKKIVEAHDLIELTYLSTQTPEKNKVNMTGSVVIPTKYNIIELKLDYFMINKNDDYMRVIHIPLIKGNKPNTFIFDFQYLLNMPQSHYEKFNIEFDYELFDEYFI